MSVRPHAAGSVCAWPCCPAPPSSPRFGIALIPLWVTLDALSPLTLLVWTVLPATAVVRAYARANRRAAANVLGTPVPDPYRSTAGQPFVARLRTVLTDPASWRDVAWMFLHAVCSPFLALLPFLYAVTPQFVFGRPFGGLFEIHTVGGSFVMLPLAALAFALWYAAAVPLTRAEAALTRSLPR